MNETSEVDKLRLPPSGLTDEILPVHEKIPAAQAGERFQGETQTLQGTERIYAFADQVKKDGNGAEEQKKEELLETWVTFSLANEIFGLPVHNVKEILRAGTITRVPHAPHPVRGVTNMRGRVLPVVDLRLRLGIRETEVSHLSRVLVVESQGRLIGLLVDSVRQVIRINRKAVQQPPPDVITNQSDYIIGVYHLQEALVILLDVDKVLMIKDSLQQMAAAGTR